jgi:dTDP-glucose 4,6-dehydratase
MRPFNTYGPRQSARAIIPTIILQFLEGKREINLGSVNTTRDFSYIDDTVNAFIKSINAKKTNGEIINLGSGSEISIKNLVRVIASEMKVKYQIVKDKKRVRPSKSEVNRLLSKNSKAIKRLKWKPIYVARKGLIKGLRETISWLSKKENFEKYKSDIYNI